MRAHTHTLYFFSSEHYLRRAGGAMAWPHGADPGVSLQLAVGVVVSDARGHAHPTAAGALGPLGGLGHTPLLQMAPHWGRAEVLS